LGFGIFAAVWAPLQGSSGKSAVAVSNLSYYEMIAITAVCYTLTCFLAHNIWKWQDNKELKRLTERKIALENQLKSYSSK
jgi:hypothetical protein